MKMRKSWSYRLYDGAAFFLKEEALNAALKKGISERLLAGRMRRTVEGNLRRVFSFTHKREPTDREMNSILKEMAALYAQSAVDSFAFSRHPEQYAKNSEPALLPALNGLLKEGRGVILATPHFGNDGMIYGSLAYRGIPVTVMINDARKHRWFTEILKTLRFIGLGEGAVEGLKALRRNETLLLYGDLNYFPEGRLMDFFGAPYPPPYGVARMALAARSPILPVYSIFESGRNRLLNDEPIRPDPDIPQEDLARRLLRSMETFIGRRPSHWFVFHPMWDGEAREKALARQLRNIVLGRRLQGRWRDLRRAFGRR